MTTLLPNDPNILAAFDRFDDEIRLPLLTLRQLIFETAAKTGNCGKVTESLKWGQPSYATNNPKSGTPIRLGAPKSVPGCYALYVPCQTNLIETIRLVYPDEFEFEGTRALLMHTSTSYSMNTISHCLELALTYYQRKTMRS